MLEVSPGCLVCLIVTSQSVSVLEMIDTASVEYVESVSIRESKVPTVSYLQVAF